ncbi:MAG: kynureninase [Oligoflexia bacterium]|nr:kynureninase [Oligoflexia bacterium]
MNFTDAHDSLKAANKMDAQDPLSRFRKEFHFPKTKSGKPVLYFAGHSLGLMPKNARTYVDEELDAWAKYGVEGHFEGKHPWLPYHENLTASFARLVGAKPTEVVAMNSLTVNLHTALVSFYKPTKSRYKILIESNTFPSDKYAVDSQARFHGFDPSMTIVELKPHEDIEEVIIKLGDTLALVMLGNCNYLSGQCFDFEKIVKASHATGAYVGFNLAHGAGNLYLQLNDWNVDFAVWCSYKYLNAGPGGIAGIFIHENHLGQKDIPRFEGWWGHNKSTRFKMGPQFDPLPTAEAWQVSNPPIFQLASLRASMELFDKATMKKLRARGDKLTNYMDWLLRKRLGSEISILTPSLPHRGSMLCLSFKENPKSWISKLHKRGVFVDFREPDIIRATPAPLYNSFADVFKLVEIFDELMHD